jgi:hypothetical protein
LAVRRCGGKRQGRSKEIPHLGRLKLHDLLNSRGLTVCRAVWRPGSSQFGLPCRRFLAALLARVFDGSGTGANWIFFDSCAANGARRLPIK